MTNNKSPQPFLRWAGSKRKLLPQLKGFWNREYNRYIEPFMGSACLFFEISPQEAILGDINEDLVSTYTQVRDNVDGVLNQLKKYKKSKEEY